MYDSKMIKVYQVKYPIILVDRKRTLFNDNNLELRNRETDPARTMQTVMLRLRCGCVATLRQRRGRLGVRVHTDIAVASKPPSPPPASTRSHPHRRLSRSSVSLPLAPPRSSLFPLPFSISFRPNGFRHPSALSPFQRSLAIKFYIYYITPFPPLSPLHVDFCNILFSSPYALFLRPSCRITYQLTRSFVDLIRENHLRSYATFFSFAPCPPALSSFVSGPSCPSCLFPVCRNLFSPSYIPPLLHPAAIYFCT
ncbi:hypothetical protein PUN28_015863 [Cardiocondyla obscurior]|uniref:Uncharacterized protein n=1 Tax=Cardiocondyla obscurior TaxID=286306 RepID=A0AAW2EPP1_9HYME